MILFAIALLFLPLYIRAPLGFPFLEHGRPYHDQFLCKIYNTDNYKEKDIKAKGDPKGEFCTLSLMSQYLDFIHPGNRADQYPNWKCDIRLASRNTDLKAAQYDSSFEFLKNAGNFLGENWIYGAKYCSKKCGCKTLDGGTLTESTKFLDVLTSGSLKDYGLNLGGLLSNKGMEILSTAKEKFKHVYALENIIECKAEVWEKSNVLANYFSVMVGVNEEWVIPALTSSPYGGHAMLLSLFKTSQDKVNLAVYNTGDGVNFHPMLQGRKHQRYSYKLEFRNLDLQNDIVDSCFFDFLVNCTTGSKKGEKFDAAYFYNHVLLIFRDKMVKDLPLEVDDYSLPQRAGNCYQKVLFAYLKDKLGKDEYKKLERALKSSLLDYLYFGKFHKRGEIQKEIVLRGFRNEIRTFLRLYLKKSITKEQLGSETEKLKQKIIIVDGVTFAAQDFSNVLTYRSMSQLLLVSPYKIYKEAEKIEYGADLKNIFVMKTTEDVLKKTAAMKNILGIRDEKICLYYAFTFITALPLPDVHEQDVYRLIGKDNLEDFEENIAFIADKVEGENAQAMGAVVAAKMVAIYWRLLVLRKSKLADSVLDLRVFELPLSSNEILFYTPEMYDEYEKSVVYLKSSTNQGTANPKLFNDLIDKQGTSLLFMSNTSAEKIYLNSLLLNIPENVLLKISTFERTEKVLMESKLGKILRDEKLRTAYMYVSGYPLVLPELSYIRQGLLKIYSFSTESLRVRKEKNRVFNGFKDLEVEKVFRMFSNPRSEEIAFDSAQINIEPKNLGSYSENDAIVSECPLAPTFLIDMKLLRDSPSRNRIYFALYCLANYTEEIFQSEPHRNLLQESFFKGIGLKRALQENPLELRRQLKKIIDSCRGKLSTLSHVTGFEEPLKTFYNFEIILQRWLGQKVNCDSCQFEDCPAMLLNEPDQIVKSFKPTYISEFQSLQLRYKYPKNIETFLLNDERIKGEILKLNGQLESCKVEFPFLGFKAGEKYYIYDYWEDQIMTASKRAGKVIDPGVFLNVREKDRLLEALKRNGDVTYSGNRYTLGKIYTSFGETVQDVGKYVLEEFYDIKETSNFSNMDKLIVQNFSVFYSVQLSEPSKNSYIIDYKLSSPDKLRGKTYLTIENKEDQIIVTEANLKWRLKDSFDGIIPDAILNFIQWKNIVLLERIEPIQSEKSIKTLVLNAFTLDLDPISISRIDKEYFYKGNRILTDHELSKKYQRCLVIRKEENGLSALLPLIRDDDGRYNTPFELFDIEEDSLKQVERKQKLKLTLYYLSHQYYEDALETLYDIKLTSAFTELEMAFLKKIILYNDEKMIDDRPEVSSISYYALYIEYIARGLTASNNEESLPEYYLTFFRTMVIDPVKDENFSKVISSYYSKIGKMPSKFLLTSLTKRKTINCAISYFHERRLAQLWANSIMPSKSSEGSRSMETFGADALMISSINKISFEYSRLPNDFPKGTPLNYYRRHDHLVNPSGDMLLTMVDALKEFSLTDDSLSAMNYLKSAFISQKIDEKNISIRFYGLYRALNHKTVHNFKTLDSDLVLDLVMKKIDFTRYERNFIEGASVRIDEPTFMLPEIDIPYITSETLKDVEIESEDVLFKELKKYGFNSISTKLKEGFKPLSTTSDIDSKFTSLQSVLLENQIIMRPLNTADLLKEKTALNNKLSQPLSKEAFEEFLQNSEEKILDKLLSCKLWLTGHVEEVRSKFEKLVAIPAENVKDIYHAAIVSELLKKIRMSDLLSAFMRREPRLYTKLLAHLDFENGKSVICKVHHLIYTYRYVTVLLRRVERAIIALNDSNASALIEELEEEIIDPEIKTVVLAMEFYLNFRIRAKNVENISKMVSLGARNDYNQIVLQSIMGSGKTVTISPALNFLKAAENRLSVFCPPSTHFETNVDKLSAYAKKMFGQETLIVHFNRTKETTGLENLTRIYEELNEALFSRKVTFIKFEDLQGMSNQLVYFLSLNDAKDESDEENQENEEIDSEDKDQTKKAVLLSKILEIFKKSANITFDEVDFTFKTNKMFNFPASTSKMLDEESVYLMKTIFSTINDIHDDLEKYHITPRNGATQNIASTTEMKKDTIMRNRDIVCRLITRKLIDKLAKDTSFTKNHLQFKEIMEIDPKEITELLENFIVNEPLGLIASIKSLSKDENQARLWVTAQHIVQSIIPDTWSTICNCNYGFSKNANEPFNDPNYCGVAKPYSFAGEPSENSSWSNKYETAVKTFQMYYENGMSEIQITEYIKFLMQLSLDEYRNTDVPLKNTRAYKRFESYGFMNGLHQIILFPGKSKQQNPLNPDFIKKLSTDLRGPSDPRLVNFISDFVFDIPMKKETFYSSQIVNTAQFMATRFKNSQGFSGTAQRDYQYWVGTDFIPDEGASIAVHASIISQKNIVYEIKIEADAWKVVTKNKPELKVYSENGEVEVDHGDSIRALIDLGAFLRTTKNELVASNIIKNTEGHIDCVIYYNEDNKLSCFKRNENDKSISGPHKLVSESSVAIAKETKVPIERTFVYYDQKHTLGSDFKMVDGTVAYVTVGPTTTRTDLEQAVMRMRGLLQGKQMLRFVLTPGVSRIIAAKMDKKEKEGQVNLQSIVEHSISNEAELFKSDDTSGKINRQNMQLVFQKIKAQYMDLVFTKMVALCANDQVDLAKMLFTSVKAWFVELTDEFGILEKSKYLDTRIVLSEFSDSFRDRLLEDDQWIEEDNAVRKVHQRCNGIIDLFLERNLVEPKTSSSAAGSNISCQVQTETQTRTQNLNEMNIEVIGYIGTKSEVLRSNECSQTLPAGNQLRNFLKDNAINPFDDNIRISRNFNEVTDSAHLNSFFKTPTYFFKTGSCIVAITHYEASEYVKNGKSKGIFTLAEDQTVGFDNSVEITDEELINLLIFSGSYTAVTKKKYEDSLRKWIERRKVFGKDLYESLQFYDRRIVKHSSNKKFLQLVKSATKKSSMEKFDIYSWATTHIDYLERNPLFFLHALIRQNLDLPKIYDYLHAKEILDALKQIPEAMAKNLFDSKIFANTVYERIHDDIKKASLIKPVVSFRQKIDVKAKQKAAEIAARLTAEKALELATKKSAELIAKLEAKKAVELAAKKSVELAAELVEEKAAELNIKKEAEMDAEMAFRMATALVNEKSVKLRAKKSAEKTAQSAADKAAKFASDKAAQFASDKAAQFAANKAAKNIEGTVPAVGVKETVDVEAKEGGSADDESSGPAEETYSDDDASSETAPLGTVNAGAKDESNSEDDHLPSINIKGESYDDDASSVSIEESYSDDEASSESVEGAAPLAGAKGTVKPGAKEESYSDDGVSSDSVDADFVGDAAPYAVVKGTAVGTKFEAEPPKVNTAEIDFGDESDDDSVDTGSTNLRNGGGTAGLRTFGGAATEEASSKEGEISDSSDSEESSESETTDDPLYVETEEESASEDSAEGEGRPIKKNGRGNVKIDNVPGHVSNNGANPKDGSAAPLDPKDQSSPNPKDQDPAEKQGKSGMSVLLIVAIVVVAILAILAGSFALYKFYWLPSLAKKDAASSA